MFPQFAKHGEQIFAVKFRHLMSFLAIGFISDRSALGLAYKSHRLD
jgi:hypothetical protein